MNDIKTFLKQLSIVHTNTSMSLRDDSKNEIIFKAHKNRDVYQTIKLLFDINENDIQEFKVEKQHYKVLAYIAKKYKDIGTHHWVYLNGKYVRCSKLHKIINDNLSKSLEKITKRKIKSKVMIIFSLFTCYETFLVFVILMYMM